MDLFEQPGLTDLALPGASVHQCRAAPLSLPADQMLEQLLELTPWRQEWITLWGKTHPQPRLSAWYGDPGTRYCYSGLQLNALPWTRTLKTLKYELEALCNAHFNSVLLNLYRDGRDRMGMHADDEDELGPRPVIASLSLGEERSLLFRHRHRRELKTLKVRQPHGSLLVMSGDTQLNWKHGINAQARCSGPRINLTFRLVRT